MKKWLWPGVALVLILFACTGQSEPLSRDNYVISVNSFYSEKQVREVTETLFTTLYAPLNIQPEFEYFPSLRGLQAANRFETDAEAGRVRRVADQYPNLIAVNEPLITHKAYWFCLEKKKCDWDTALLYAVPGGFQAALEFCEKHQYQCLPEYKLPFMSSLLGNGAVDALLGNKKLLMGYFCHSGQPTVYYRATPELEVVSYHLVNRRHSDKIDALAASIRQMHKRGDFDRFVAFLSAEPTNCTTEFIALP